MAALVSTARVAATRAATRRYLAARLPASRLFDQEFYEAQVGTSFPTERAALRDFLARATTGSYAPNPLFEAHWYAGSWTRATSPYLRTYLRSGPGRHDVGPLFDSAVYLEEVPEAATHPGGALGHFLVTASPNSVLPVSRGQRLPVPPWGEVRTRLLSAARHYAERTSQQRLRDTEPPHRDLDDTDPHHADWQDLGRRVVDWAAVRRTADSRVPGRVSISMPTFQDWRMTVRAVRAVLEHSGDHDVEVIVVENGSGRSFAAILDACFVGEPRVRVEPLPHNLHWAIGSNLGMAQSSGSTIVFLNNNTEVIGGWLDALIGPLDDPSVRGVQSLLLGPDGTIQNAGYLFTAAGRPPTAALAGLPPEDAYRAGTLEVRTAAAAALAVRPDEFARLDGFDPAFVNGQWDVDYGLRATVAGGGRFVVATSSVVVHREQRSPGRQRRSEPDRALLVDRWGAALRPDADEVIAPTGLRVAGLTWPEAPYEGAITVPAPVYTRPSRLVASGPRAGLPSLRWALKLAAHPGPRGDGWGDVHFGRALTSALERLGQEVVVDRREAHQRDFRELDDVVLVLRGLEEVPAQDGAVNLLWVISHPDLVTETELTTYDRIFAASVPWARRMAALGHPAVPLLQATDPTRFHPGMADTAHHLPTLFVGRSRNVLRPIVQDTLEAGVDLALYGDGWEQFGLSDRVAGQYLPPDELGRAYASADIVLNDHWADMAREGFLSNRLFDAVATGARVVSDDVAGIEEVFEGCVQVYRSAAELGLLCSPAGRGRFPDDAARLRVAERIALEHSFDQRAGELLDTALELRGARQG